MSGFTRKVERQQQRLTNPLFKCGEKLKPNQTKINKIQIEDREIIVKNIRKRRLTKERKFLLKPELQKKFDYLFSCPEEIKANHDLEKAIKKQENFLKQNLQTNK